MSVYGNPKPVLKSDTIDKSGVRHLALSQIWQPRQPGLSTAEMLAECPNAPVVPGFTLVLPIKTELQGGYFETTWTLDGPATGILTAGAVQDRSNSTDWTFEPIWQEKSLALHPNFQNLLADYSGTIDATSGRINWQTPLSVSNGSGLDAGSSNTIDNPMYGRQTYFDLTGGIYSFRYTQKDRYSGLYAYVGNILATGSLPGLPPNFPNRNWMKIQPKESKATGSLFKFEEIFWLSEEGGWPKQIYPAIKTP